MRSCEMWPPVATLWAIAVAPWGTSRENTASFDTVPEMGRTSAQPQRNTRRHAAEASASISSTYFVPS